MFRFTKPALVAGAIGVTGAGAGGRSPPHRRQRTSTRRRRTFLTCKPLGAGTICSGTIHDGQGARRGARASCAAAAPTRSMIHDQGRR